MRFSRLLPAFAIALLAFTPVAPARAEVLISIDKFQQQMTVTVDGEARHVWPVSTGRRAYDTPAGEFQPFRMARHHFSREWDDAPMPHSIFFTQEGHAIHGSYELRRLGRPASHGCVRLAPENAATLFALVKHGVKNARVTLTGDLPSATELAARNGNNDADAPAPRPRNAAPRQRRRYFGRAYYYRERPYYARHAVTAVRASLPHSAGKEHRAPCAQPARRRRSKQRRAKPGAARQRILPHPGAAEQRIRQLPQSGCRRPAAASSALPASAANGSWDTQKWLIGKSEAHLDDEAAGGRQRGGGKGAGAARLGSAPSRRRPLRQAAPRRSGRTRSRRRPCVVRNGPTSEGTGGRAQAARNQSAQR